MSKAYIEKNLKLSLELNRYLSRTSRALEKIPKGAYIVITQTGDEAFNRSSLSMVNKVKGKNRKCIEARKEGSKWVLQPITN